MYKKKLYRLINSDMVSRQICRRKKDSSGQIFFVKVDPKEISHISILPDNSQLISGSDAVTGPAKGIFDIIKFPFKKDFMYLTVKDMLNNVDWKETPYYRKLIKKKTHNKAIVHLEKLNWLIQTLEKNKYLSQYELGNLDQMECISNWNVPRHEILIGMDRKGRYFRLKGGRHRLAVAQNLGITEMPAILTLYHERAEHLLPKIRRPITGNKGDFNPII